MALDMQKSGDAIITEQQEAENLLEPHVATGEAVFD